MENGDTLEAQAREAIASMTRDGFSIEGIEAKIRGKGLSKEQEDALLDEARPHVQAARDAMDLRHAAEARGRLELAAAYAAGEKRRKMQAAAPIAIGVVLLIGGIAFSLASAGSALESGGHYVSFFGLTGVGLGIVMRARQRPEA